MATNSTDDARDTKGIMTRLTESEYEALTALAEANDRSIAAEVRRMIRAHLESVKAAS